MKEKSYKKLKGLNKTYFDILCLKMSDKYDVDKFKLKFNQELFDIIYYNQKRRIVKSKEHYESLVPLIFKDVEKKVFIRNKDGVSEDSILIAIDQALILTSPFQKNFSGFSHSHVVLRLVVSTLSLNNAEIELLKASIPSNYDEESSSIVIAVATLPIYSKYPTEKLSERWAKAVSRNQISKYHKHVFGKSSFNFQFLFYFDDINIRYFH
jgi:hypothetical protein